MSKPIQTVPLKVSLLSYPTNPLSIISESAKITRGIDQTKYSDQDYFQLLYKMGHHSVFEHIAFSFRIDGISRACSHQLVRFRIGVSFTQRSQRYTDESSLQTITPPSITNNEKTIKLYNEYLEYSQITYSNLLQQGIPREDARFVLPNASSTSLIMTMNYRELIHACGLRLCSKAQWEIQDLFTEIKKEIHCLDPFLGKYLQPKCIHNGFCSERKPCKTPETIQSQWKKLHT